MQRITTTLLAALFVLSIAACGTLTGNDLTFKTADPNLSVGFHLIPPALIPQEEVGEIVPEPLPAPPCVVVKGNISKDGRKLYHVEGMANFNTVKIDEAAGERFFCSEQEAIDAGWIRAGN